MIIDSLAALWGPALLVIQIAGVWYALHAVMTARTPQSAIGWGLALVLLPIVAIPLFWVFGQSVFSGYVSMGTGKSTSLDQASARVLAGLEDHYSAYSHKYSDSERMARNLRGMRAIGGNAVRLLVDGEATFHAIFEAISKATNFVVVQFYIIHNDGLGKKLQQSLLDAASRGVTCYVLYDAVGSKGLDEHWIGPLRKAGVHVKEFVTNRERGRRFQINFRNHRKLVLVDGQVGFVGGLNAGDEYLGLGPLGAWRDTHLRIEGPAATSLLISFFEDWNYAAGNIPELTCKPQDCGTQRVLPFASGPAQTWHVAPAVYLEIMHDVRERLWIASPYFVPDPATRTALAHAALRGVDVRILLPGKPDHLMPWLSSFTLYPQMREAGVRIWRMKEGFMHQKVLLADSDLAIVGSVNLDYRSFMINFELAAAIQDTTFAKDVETMFNKDFAASREEDLHLYERSNFFFRLKCRLASLMSPEQ
jgi:cardiolipin synthase